jgi:hypothetical protein
MSDASKAAIAAATNQQRQAAATNNPTGLRILAGLPGKVTTAGSFNTIAGIPVGFIVAGLAILGVVVVVIVRKVSR